MKLIFALIFLTLINCASPRGPKYIGLEEHDDTSEARGQAYSGDGITIRYPMKVSAPDWKPFEFFFKDCHDIGPHFYYSKTAYACTYP